MKAGYEEQRIKKKGTENGKREGKREHCNTERVSLKFSEKDVYTEIMEQVFYWFLHRGRVYFSASAAKTPFE